MSYDNLAKHYALIPPSKPLFKQPRPLLSGNAAYLVGTQNPKLQAQVIVKITRRKK